LPLSKNRIKMEQSGGGANRIDKRVRGGCLFEQRLLSGDVLQDKL
jgi:hypothetical protein